MFDMTPETTHLVSSSLALRAAPDWARTIGFREEAKTTAPITLRDPNVRANTHGRYGHAFDTREHRYGPRTVFMAHQTEGLVAQATNKFTDLVNKGGFSIITTDKQREAYLMARIAFLGRCTKTSLRAIIKEVSREFIAYGNAYLLKVYEKDIPIVIGGKRLKTASGLHGDESRGVIAGLFRLDPRAIEPRYDKRTGRHTGWLQKIESKADRQYRLDEVIHFAYQRPAGEVLGISMHRPVLDDIRALRDQEEYAIKLFEKMLFPIVHHEVPAHGDDAFGLPEDVDQAAYAHTGIAPDGILVTPPGHKITMIGAAGEALNPVPQLEYMMRRIFMGLGVSGVVMGMETSSAGTSDVLTTQIHDRVKSFQQDLEEVLNLHLVPELCLEGGFDISDPIVQASFLFAEIEHAARIRQENHSSQMFTTGVFTETEARKDAQRNPLTAAERKGKHVYTDQIPVIQATADITTDSTKETAEHAHGLAKDAASHDHRLNKDLAQHGHALSKDAIAHQAKTQKDLVTSGATPDAKQQIQLARIQSQTAAHKAATPVKPAVRRAATTQSAKSHGAARAGANKNNPANQHGKRGVARASATPAAGRASQRKAQSAKDR